MDVAALIAWLLTAAGGFVLLGTWIAKGGHRPDAAARAVPPALVFGHFLLAAAGLVLWIVYVAADSDGLTWVAFASPSRRWRASGCSSGGCPRSAAAPRERRDRHRGGAVPGPGRARPRPAGAPPSSSC